MITRQEILDDGWIDGKDNFGNHRYEKTIGRATYYCNQHNLKESIYIGVFVRQDPEEVWSMSMWSKLFDGRCPDMDTFHVIFDLVARW